MEKCSNIKCVRVETLIQSTHNLSKQSTCRQLITAGQYFQMVSLYLTAKLAYLKETTCKWKESMNNLKQEFFACQKRKPRDSKCCKNDETQTQQPPYPNNHIRI